MIGEPDPPISVFGISHDLPREVGEDRSPSGNLPGVVVQAEECCQIGPDVHHRRLRSRAPALIPAGEEVEVDVGSDLIDAPSLSIALAVWAKRLILNIAALASPAGRSRAAAYTGTSRWAFRLKKRLAAGSYTLTARATGPAGSDEAKLAFKLR